MPDKIKKWNWGAFFLTWIWGLFNKSYWTLLVFIPYFGIIWAFVCGVKGNKWAWKNKGWNDIESFNKVQKKWAIIGGIICIPFYLWTVAGMILPLLM